MSISKNHEKGDESPAKSDESGTEKPKSSPARKMVLLLLLVATIVVVGLDYLPEGDSESEVVGPPARKLKPPVESPVQPQRPAAPKPAHPTPAPAPTPPQYEKPPETLLVSISPSDVPVPVPSPAEPAMTEVTPTLPVQADSELVVVVDNLGSASKSVARPLPDGTVPSKVNRYARRLLDRYDTNGDGVIDATEWRQMQGNPKAMDFNADGEITLEELAAYAADFGRHRRMRLTGSMVEEAVAELPPLYIPTAERDAIAAAQEAAQQAEAVPVALVNETVEADMEPTADSEGEEEGDDTGETAEPERSQPATDQVSSKRFVTPKSRLAGVPEWFLTKDANGDGQLTVSEYAPRFSESPPCGIRELRSQQRRRADGEGVPEAVVGRSCRVRPARYCHLGNAISRSATVTHGLRAMFLLGTLSLEPIAHPFVG